MLQCRVPAWQVVAAIVVAVALMLAAALALA
jgi:hypothetical protein